MPTAEDLVRSSFRNTDLALLLRQPIEALLGVTAAAKAELAAYGIATIFDLAASPLFQEAAALVAAANDPNSDWALAGGIPRSVVDVPIDSLPIELVPDRGIEELRSISETIAAQLSATLGVATIRELASWPPYQAARQILQEMVGRVDPDSVWDPGTPPELLPTMGRHPTERAYYQTILLERFLEPPPKPDLDVAYVASPFGSWVRDLIDDEREYGESLGAPGGSIPLERAGQVDIAAPVLSGRGFEKPALGAIVQMSQSWYTSGLSLGQLLHSLALAPGESTRIAMIDWQRRMRGSGTEATSERDQLDSTLVNNRALNEVVNAVATEIQSGSSAAQSNGESWGFGKSGGGGGAIGGGDQGGQNYGFGGGYSFGYGTGKGSASAWSVSTGQRNLRSELTQNVHELTQQASTLARNRWATVVREVSEEEHEQISTRAVTNYNHMHALTIQYYEVVQLYRVSVEIDRVTRCLFVPMKVLDFSSREVIARFAEVISSVALIPGVARAFRAPAGIAVFRLAPNAVWYMQAVAERYGAETWSPESREMAVPAAKWRFFLVGFIDAGHPFRSLVIEWQDGRISELPLVIGDRSKPPVSWHGLYDVIGSPIGTWSATIRRVWLRRAPGKEAFAGPVDVEFRGVEQGETAAEGTENVGGTIVVWPTAGGGDVLLFDLSLGADLNEIAAHLRQNALHYSQAIWRSLDAAAISLALAPYTIGGRPLMEYVDPTPVTIAGNYLVLRTYVTDASWNQFLEEKELRVGPVSSTVVPLPSGGVFAEAVLGRSNSAEKLDMTRFWNWQDSPIPITAPDIAALQAGSRHQELEVASQPLSPSVLNVMSPASFPDPTGMAAAMSALAQGAMFRDMSGLAATIGLSGTAMQEAFKGSSAAQQWAAENFKTAASIFSKGGRSGTVSEEGAKANQAQSMDAREKAKPGSVGKNEQDNFSDPPLLQARGSLPEEWAPWPGGSEPEEWAPWPGSSDEDQSGLKTGGGDTTPVPKKKRPVILPVTFAFRVFVPADVWQPVPTVAVGPAALTFRGDSRGFQATGGRSQAELTYELRIDANRLRVTEETPAKVRYGLAELYSAGDTAPVAGKPGWWRTRNPGAQPAGSMSRRLEHVANNFDATYEELGDRIVVIFTIDAKPHFPWSAEDLKAVPNLELFGLELNWAVDLLRNAGVWDMDARIVVTITKRSDGMVQYDVAGSHDRFPAYELYINGEPAYRWGTDAQLAAEDAPENLAPPADNETIQVDSTRVIPLQR